MDMDVISNFPAKFIVYNDAEWAFLYLQVEAIASPFLLLFHSHSIKGVNDLILEVLSKVMGRAVGGSREGEVGECFQKECSVLGLVCGLRRELEVKEEKHVNESSKAISQLPWAKISVTLKYES